jgi:hypothetical protein
MSQALKAPAVDVLSAALYVASSARDERREVETVGRSDSPPIGLETARGTLEEPQSPHTVATGLVCQSHAQLGQPLPQLALLVRGRLPPDLKGFVRSEWASRLEETTGVCQGLGWRTRFFGDLLDARLAIRQRASERVTRSSLLCSPLLVSITITNHVNPLRDRP